MNVFKLVRDIEKIDPEMYDRLDSRRAMFKGAGKAGLKIAAAAVPFAMGSMFSKAYGQSTSGIADVLNFALTLEYLEDEFYAKGLAAAGLIPADRRAIFQQIGKHETAHVKFLQDTLKSLNATAVAKPTFDFTAGGAFADVFSNYTTFLALAQAFEDTGVRAYKGQAGNLISSNAVLTAALQIHSVEGRHASMVRRLRGQQGWINLNEPSGLPAAIYAGEENTTQGGVNVTTLGASAAIASQAFDEALTKDQVLAIVKPFIKA